MPRKGTWSRARSSSTLHWLLVGSAPAPPPPPRPSTRSPPADGVQCSRCRAARIIAVACTGAGGFLPEPVDWLRDEIYDPEHEWRDIIRSINHAAATSGPRNVVRQTYHNFPARLTLDRDQDIEVRGSSCAVCLQAHTLMFCMRSCSRLLVRRVGHQQHDRAWSVAGVTRSLGCCPVVASTCLPTSH